MPELPEVETITNRLRPYLVGKRIAEVIKLHPKSFSSGQLLVVGYQITDVARRAKMIRIQLVDPNKKDRIRNPANGGKNKLNLLIHLKMTGQLIYVDQNHRVGGGHPTEDWIQALPSNHTRIEFHFMDGSKLFFNDQRVFGWIKVMSDEEVLQEFSKYALDITDPQFTLEYFSLAIAHSSRAIKVLIMDNTLMSGVGNIYACDSLNLARISPFHKANDLTADQVESLYNALKAIIQKGIDLGGATTDGKYIDVHGFAGKYQLQARVYDKKGQPCPNCGEKIMKEKLAGRGTYYCNTCQH